MAIEHPNPNSGSLGHEHHLLELAFDNVLKRPATLS